MLGQHANLISTVADMPRAMNAHSPLGIDDDRLRGAYGEVNCWRGHCIHHFSRAEASICAALERLIDPTTSRSSNTGLLGQRIEKLRGCLNADGPLGARAATVLEALNTFSDLMPFRNTLVHAHGQVLLNHRGEWTWAYHMSAQSKAMPASKGFFTSGEAEDRLRELQGATQRLVSLLEKCRK